MTQGEVSIDIAAAPERVWALVSDMTRTSEWSPECVRVELDGQAAPGARFVGHNRLGSREWQMHGVVDTVDQERRFSFHTERDGQARTRWSYALEPTASGTRLTESWERLWKPPLLARAVERLVMGGRDKHNRANVQASLERIKALAETG